MSCRLFNIEAIHESLKSFQADFPSINARLAIKRDDVSDELVNYIVEAYGFLNTLLEQEVDLFSPAGFYSLLELNHTVLCGADPSMRMDYYQHITETRSRFTKRIRPIRVWVEKNRAKTNPYKLATGFYSRNLSQPQLFIEGNHRTGNMVLNYLLISRGAAPFIISPETAEQYLEISGDIKFTDKDSAIGNNVSLPGHRKRFIAMLEEKTDSKFLLD